MYYYLNVRNFLSIQGEIKWGADVAKSSRMNSSAASGASFMYFLFFYVFLVFLRIFQILFDLGEVNIKLAFEDSYRNLITEGVHDRIIFSFKKVADDGLAP